MSLEIQHLSPKAADDHQLTFTTETPLPNDTLSKK